MFVPAADTGSVVSESTVAGVADNPEGVDGTSSERAGAKLRFELSSLTSRLLVFAIFAVRERSGHIGLVPDGRLRRDRVLPHDCASEVEEGELCAPPKTYQF
jgi:hypothetical protein